MYAKAVRIERPWLRAAAVTWLFPGMVLGLCVSHPDKRRLLTREFWSNVAAIYRAAVDGEFVGAPHDA